MDYATLDDETLIRLTVRAQAGALGALYDRYGRLVFSVALHTVGDQQTAEEVTQDVFTSVWEKAGSYRPGQAKVSTWLLSIARYRSIDVLRRRGARPEKRSVDWQETPPELLPSAAGPESAVELHLEQERLRAALATLPDDQRQALALAFFDGYTHNEIAAALGQPLGTVKTRIRLAMQKLRTLLRDERVAI